MQILRVSFLLTVLACGAGSDAESNLLALSLTATQHSRCGWIGQDFYESGVASFQANPAYFQAIHPVWYQIGADSLSIRALANAGDPRVANGAAALEPTLMDSGSAAVLRTMLNDATTRSAHVDNIVALVVAQGYAGI